MTSLAEEIAIFLRDTPQDSWDDILWTDIIPYLPADESIQAAHIYVTLANAIEDFQERCGFADPTPLEPADDPITAAREKIAQILSRPQVAQRTEEWYTQALRYLTASQFGTLYASPRTRGQLVLEKAGVTAAERHGQRLVTPSDYMSPFDWGIRFEPVIRTIYSALTSTVVTDVGRLYHRSLDNLAASPDGLVVEDTSASQERLGRLVEYKAPVTRKLLQKIPSEYYMQMQIQMEVADIDRCDYCEMKFYSRYNDKMCEPCPKETHYRGYVALIMKDGVLDRYEYSPLNPPADWTYAVDEDVNERVYERIEWWLEDYYLETVARDRTWFAGTIPIMEAFWFDVEEAKAGRFVLPEKKAAAAAKKRRIEGPSIMDEPEETGLMIIDG
jgi:hypothetical protein